MDNYNIDTMEMAKSLHELSGIGEVCELENALYWLKTMGENPYNDTQRVLFESLCKAYETLEVVKRDIKWAESHNKNYTKEQHWRISCIKDYLNGNF